MNLKNIDLGIGNKRWICDIEQNNTSVYLYYEVVGGNADGTIRLNVTYYMDYDLTYTQYQSRNLDDTTPNEKYWYSRTGYFKEDAQRIFKTTTVFAGTPLSFAISEDYQTGNNLIQLSETFGEPRVAMYEFLRDVTGRFREVIETKVVNIPIGLNTFHAENMRVICSFPSYSVGGEDYFETYSIRIEGFNLTFADYIYLTPKENIFLDTEDIEFTLTHNERYQYYEQVTAQLVQGDDKTKAITPEEIVFDGGGYHFASIRHVMTYDETARNILYDYMKNKTEAEVYIVLAYSGTNSSSVIMKTAHKITIRLEEVETGIETLYPKLNYTLRNNSDMNYTDTLTGNPKTLVRGVSDVEITLNTEGVKGAQIVEQYIRSSEAIVGTDYYLGEDTTSTSFTYYAKDSRGFTTTIVDPEYKLINYIPPTAAITNIGQPTLSNTCSVSVAGDYWNHSFGARWNGLSFEYRYKSTSTPEYVDWITAIDRDHTDQHPGVEYGPNNNYNATFDIYLPNHVDSFTIQIRAQDMLRHDDSNERTTRALPVFDWSESDFNFNVPVTVQGDLVVSGTITSNTPVAQQIEPADYIIEQGTRQTGSGNSLANWTFRKWNSGMYECWCRKHIQTGVSTAWGGLYVSGALPHTNLIWPGAFIDIPVANITIAPNASGAFLIAGGSTNLTATNTGGYEIARGTSLSSGNFYINYYGMGRWK